MLALVLQTPLKTASSCALPPQMDPQSLTVSFAAHLRLPGQRRCPAPRLHRRHHRFCDLADDCDSHVVARLDHLLNRFCRRWSRSRYRSRERCQLGLEQRKGTRSHLGGSRPRCVSFPCGRPPAVLTAPQQHLPCQPDSPPPSTFSSSSASSLARTRSSGR